MAKDAGATTTKSVGALRKAMKKAREAWRANKEDKSLKKKFRKAKKALEAAKEAAKGSAAPSAEAKKAKKKKEKKRKQAGENHDSANGDAKSVKKKKKAKNKKEKSKKQAAASPGEGNVSSSATASEIKAFREENKIKLQGKAVEGAQPFLSFSDLKFPKKYLYALQGFEKPTPIQAEAWPLALKGRDIIGIAATGPLMLVLSPTRELAQQTNRVCEAVCKGCGIRSVCVIGGMDKWKMAQQFRGGMHVLVATPGRLLGFVREGEICLANVEYAVLDEADRMLDMGFEPDVRKIMSMVKKSDERQTLLFSATWPQEVQKLGLEFVQNPVIIYIGDRGEKLVANKRVSQTIEVIEESRRDHRLHQLLEKYHNGTNRVIVFALYKKEAARVETMLRRRGWKVQSIHGDKSQDARTAALNRFKDGSEPLLVATDVAARGLDVEGVEVVLNYAFPLTVEDYVHRIGRTGRAGKSGISHTFFTKANKGLSGELIQVLNEAGAPVPKDLMAFGTGTKRKKHAMYGDHFRAYDGPMPKATRIVF